VSKAGYGRAGAIGSYCTHHFWYRTSLIALPRRWQQR
jgi:hypothetical protein